MTPDPNIPALIAAARRFLAEVGELGGLDREQPRLLSIKAVARHLGCSERKARSVIKGSTAGRFVAGKWYVRESDLHLLGDLNRGRQ